MLKIGLNIQNFKINIDNKQGAKIFVMNQPNERAIFVSSSQNNAEDMNVNPRKIIIQPLSSTPSRFSKTPGFPKVMNNPSTFQLMTLFFTFLEGVTAYSTVPYRTSGEFPS